MKKRIVSFLLVLVMLLGMVPMASAANAPQWAGAANMNDANNQVTTIAMPTAAAYTAEKWAYGLNTTAANFGIYYAGQVTIADGYLYATGGGKLHKVDIATGAGTVINESAGTYGNYYDYIVYADGVLVVATQTKLEAFALTGQSLGSVSGSFGYYHPVQYQNGYVICNGFIYKLEKTDSAVTFTQVGTAAIGGDTFSWSSGAFVGDKFYVAGKTTVYAVDYTTNTVTDSYVFDADRTSTLQSVAYDAVTGRLFWGSYTNAAASRWTEKDRAIHSVKVNTDGTLDENSYLSADASQPTVCTPVISGSRVYLAGQAGDITVLNAADLSVVYTADVGVSKIQSTPIVSTAYGVTRVYVQGYDGHLYVLTDGATSGTVEKLAATKNYSGVQYPNAYEQIAVDANGDLYCYNESGYLFCFTAVECEVPAITTDLSTAQVKLAKDSQANTLTVAASVTDGGTLSYQWQASQDNKTWTDIPNAVDASYTPSTAAEGTTYYRCTVTNTKDGKTAKAVSAAANILVKVLSSDTTLNVLINAGNTATSSTPVKAATGADGIHRVENRTASVRNIWLGTVSDGTVTSFEILQGLASNRSMPGFTAKTSSNVYDGTTYLGYYRSTYYTLPIVAKATVTAEDGVTTKTHYIVVASGTAGQYSVSVDGFTADAETYYNAASGIAFTEAGQTVTLTPKTTTIGTGLSGDTAVIWSSSDVKVATVDANGVVTSVGGGTATITATLGRMTASCTVASSAAAHTTHTYAEGVCNVCGTAEPAALAASFTLAGQDGKFVKSKDGTTDLYKVSLSVSDLDKDGALTLNDAFLAAHEAHSTNGAADFLTVPGAYGAYITKLWGIESSSVGYFVNDASVLGLDVALKRNDVITAFFYQDTQTYADVYTYFENDSVNIVAGEAETFTVKASANGSDVVPKGATVKVLDSQGTAARNLSATVGEDGTFSLTFPEAGTYILEVGGTASYTGSVWDYTLNDYKQQEFPAAPVTPSRMTVEVLPYVEKTVYVTVALKDGTFAVGKNGDELYRLALTVEDDKTAPDGQVTLQEVGKAIHEQHHPDGTSAYSATTSWVSKFWGNTSGSFGYYLNDTYMDGAGTNTGTGGRPFQDKLMGTVVEDGDCFTFFIYQSSSWSDMYTYFDPVSESAVAGTAKTFTAKAAGYGAAQKPSGAAIKVTDSTGAEQNALNTTVGSDGTFSITFPAAGTYTVELRTNGTSYFVPSRCIVHVSAAPAGGVDPAEPVYISVVDPQGRTYFEKTGFTPNAGETAFSLLQRTGLTLDYDTDNQWGTIYVHSIEGFGEFDAGGQSGWMFRVNGVYPDVAASVTPVFAGDYVEWIYTRKLGSDIGGGYVGSTTTDKTEDKTEDKTDETTTAKMPFSDVETHWGKDAVQYVWEKGLMNGTGETVFSPDLTTSRGMIATILYRLEGEGAVTTSGTFTDVAAGQWYTDPVEWAVVNGIVTGYGDGTFGPNDPITREQMAVILFRYAQYKGMDAVTLEENLHFSDASSISEYAVTAMNWAVGQGLITGMADGTLAPKGTATRAQVATILMRYLSK